VQHAPPQCPPTFAATRNGSASPYLTVQEASEYLRCKPQRVHDLLSQGRLTRFKDGGRTLVSRAEIEAWLDRYREGRA
jgi:excisionase family DNA binding protein